MPRPRFRAERATNLPAGAYNRALVYDWQTHAVARKDDGVLAYFRTMAAAKRWAAAANEPTTDQLFDRL